MKTFIETAMECGAKMKVFNCTFAGTKSCPCEEQNIDNCVSRKAHSVVINEAQFQATFDDYCKQFEPACVIKSLKNDDGFTYNGLNDEINVCMPQGTKLYTKPQPAQITSEPARWMLGREDGTIDKYSAIYRSELDAQSYIDSFNGEFTAFVIALYTAPQQTSEVKAYIERLEYGLLQASRHLDLLEPNSAICKIVSEALASKPNKCVINRWSSRCCELGTKSCEVQHTKPECLKD